MGGGIGCHALVLMMDPRRGGRRHRADPDGRRGSAVDRHGAVRAHPAAPAAEHRRRHVPPFRQPRRPGGGRRGVNITFKLLYNSAVAMTGGQQAVGAMPIRPRCRAAAAEGVPRDRRHHRRSRPATGGVRLRRGVQVRHRDRLAEAQEELAAIDGVTVLIHDQECATELRRKRKRGWPPSRPSGSSSTSGSARAAATAARSRTACRSSRSTTEFGRKTRIHQSSCNKDYSCLDGDCPSFLTVIPSAGRERPGSTAPALRRRTPSPTPRSGLTSRPDASPCGITGVGGTGVVTVSQILAHRGRDRGPARSVRSTRPAWPRRAARSSPTSSCQRAGDRAEQQGRGRGVRPLPRL